MSVSVTGPSGSGCRLLTGLVPGSGTVSPRTCSALSTERGIAWRCRDSISLPPEDGHSTLSKTRKRLSLEAHGSLLSAGNDLLGTCEARPPTLDGRTPGRTPRGFRLYDPEGRPHPGHRARGGGGDAADAWERSRGRQGLRVRDQRAPEGPRAAQLCERAEPGPPEVERQAGRTEAY